MRMCVYHSWHVSMCMPSCQLMKNYTQNLYTQILMYVSRFDDDKLCWDYFHVCARVSVFLCVHMCVFVPADDKLTFRLCPCLSPECLRIFPCSHTHIHRARIQRAFNTHILTYIHTYTQQGYQAIQHTFIRTYSHIYIHTHSKGIKRFHTYILTYIHTHAQQGYQAIQHTWHQVFSTHAETRKRQIRSGVERGSIADIQTQKAKTEGMFGYGKYVHMYAYKYLRTYAWCVCYVCGIDY
jgi:hypothetical protein